jgi:predicted nucleic acid-binding protein
VSSAEPRFGISPLTLAEALVGPARLGKLDAAQKAIRELGVAAVALSEQAPARLAAMRASTRLRLPDCCVLLAAETAQAQVATFDDRLAAAAADLGLLVRS